MAGRGIYVETVIDADLETVWARTQQPAQHVRWDIRFSRIVPEREAADEGEVTRFTYARSTPFHTVNGVGVSLGERSGADGSRTSALKFSTDDPLSPIRAGRGYWRYVERPEGGIRFLTGYDYDPGWGALLDRVARPALGWATAWSFDRLRIWVERGEAPERWPLWSVLWFWRRDRPRAGRCRRAPAGGRRHADHLAAAPDALASLPDPVATR